MRLSVAWGEIPVRKDGVAITTGMPKYPIFRIKFVLFAVEARCMSPGPVRLLRGRAYFSNQKSDLHRLGGRFLVFDERAEIRTRDPRIKSPMLYRLSYAP